MTSSSDNMKRENILILNIDRDDDIGQKANIKGPIVGKEEVIRTAVELGKADPSDSDLNALFQSVKVYDDIRKDSKAEVAVLTGDKNVGIKSDRKIASQLEDVLKNFKADNIILVTDGSEDENLIPIIQSKVSIISVERVIVKQSERLESTYYKIKDFIDESMENPKYARLIFGLPAITFLLYAFFGIEGWRLIIGAIGMYLFIKGFKLDDYILAGFDELKTSFTRRRFSFFTYIVAAALIILASVRGIDAAFSWINIGIFETAASFVVDSIYFFYFAGMIAWIGKNISSKKRAGKTIISVTVFGFAITFVIWNAANLILKPDLSMFNFILSIIIGFAIMFVALLIEWKK